MSSSAAVAAPSPPPPVIFNLDDPDNDDEVTVLYAATPAAVPHRHKRTIPINTANNPISVENYSFKRTQTRRNITIPIIVDLSAAVDDDDDVQILRSVTATNRKKHPSGCTKSNSVTERGEPSNEQNSKLIEKEDDQTLTFTCEICVERTPYDAAFFIMGGCTHSYCSDCMVRYIASRLQDNITQIRCPAPSCPGLLEPDHCRSLLPKEVFDRWGNALCEAVLLASEKYYCPFKDCSAPLLVEDGDYRTITESECPNCRRMFCAKCKVPWHAGIKCEEYEKLSKDERGKEDIMLMQLANKKKWIRCPKCRFYVEKSTGCLFMKCRCGNTFCYNCGSPLKDHYCKNCKH